MTKPLLALTATLLLPTATLAQNMYPSSSPVLQLDAKSYQNLIAKSNHTSIVEFYAPWCGHCKNLKPAYEKAAKSLAGLAKVAAVNCDDEPEFCGQMGVKGFPTLKIVRPGKKPGQPTVENYEGPRSAKGIVDTVVGRIPNHVKRLKDGDFSDWLEANDKPKAILFTEKGTVGALLKSIAIEFLGSIEVAQVRDKEKAAVDVFGVTKFPTLVLVPGDDKDPVKYDGEMKKEAIIKFLSQSATPNPDPAPQEKKSKKSKSSKPSESKQKKAPEPKPESPEEPAPDSDPSSPEVIQPDTPKPTIPAIPTLADSLALQQKCLNTASKTCILALLPPSSSAPDDNIHPAIPALSEIHHKHTHAKRPLFPFYQLPTTNPFHASLISALSLPSSSTSQEEISIIAINGKKGWYRTYPSSSPYTLKELEDWIDAIRMSEGAKQKVPEGVVVEADTLPVEPVVVVPASAENEKGPGKEGVLPEGVDVTVEEVQGEEYERIIEEAKRAGKEREGKEKTKKEEKKEQKETGGEAKEEAKCPFGHDEKGAHDEL